MIVSVTGWTLLADGWLFDGFSNRLAAMFTAISSVLIGAGIFLIYIAKSRIIAEKEWFLLPMGRRMAMMQLRFNTNGRGSL
jgi:PST family polysaccharide transporter